MNYPHMYPNTQNQYPQFQPQLYPQVPQQQQEPRPQQQPYSPSPSDESIPINASSSSSSHCLFRRSCRNRVLANADKKLLYCLFFGLVLSAPLSVVSTGTGFVVALVPKFMAFALGFCAARQKPQTELSHGIFFGFQMFSILFTLAMGFNGFFSFLFAALVLIMEAFTLVFSGKLVCDIAEARRARLTGEKPEEATQEEEDVVAVPEQPQQVFQEVYPQVPQNYGAATYMQSHIQPPQPMPQQYQQQPAPVSQHSDELEALFQKYSVQLNLLDEMSFAQNFQQKCRNARLLEKYQGNIQQVVSEIVMSQ